MRLVVVQTDQPVCNAGTFDFINLPYTTNQQRRVYKCLSFIFCFFMYPIPTGTSWEDGGDVTAYTRHTGKAAASGRALGSLEGATRRVFRADDAITGAGCMC